jgi:hypothetical protein
MVRKCEKEKNMPKASIRFNQPAEPSRSSRPAEPQKKSKKKWIAIGAGVFAGYAVIASTLSYFETYPGWWNSYENETILEDYGNFDYVEYHPSMAKVALGKTTNYEGDLRMMQGESYATGYVGADHLNFCVLEAENDFEDMVLWAGAKGDSSRWTITMAIKDSYDKGDPKLIECQLNQYSVPVIRPSEGL